MIRHWAHGSNPPESIMQTANIAIRSNWGRHCFYSTVTVAVHIVGISSRNCANLQSICTGDEGMVFSCPWNVPCFEESFTDCLAMQLNFFLAHPNKSDAWDVFVAPLVQISGSQKKASSSGIRFIWVSKKEIFCTFCWKPLHVIFSSCICMVYWKMLGVYWATLCVCVQVTISSFLTVIIFVLESLETVWLYFLPSVFWCCCLGDSL